MRGSRTSGPSTPIFVPARGQYDNIGDIILRRRLLDWARPWGALHIYVGDAPTGYLDGLGLGPDDTVYRSFRRWYLSGLAAGLGGRAAYFFKPGEVQLSLVGLKEHISMLPVLVALRSRRGVVVRVGSGARNFARWARLAMLPSVGLGQLTLWRDQETADYMGTGEVMPDLAFGETSGEPAAASPDTVVVSMRGDRPFPEQPWIDAVRAFADRRGLRLVVITQVFRDRERSRELAGALGAELLDWDGTAHDRQEARLREVYRRCALALSDRLHVLVAAATEGAAPSAAIGTGSPKIDRHFAPVGLTGVGVDVSGHSVAEIDAVLQHALDRREATGHAVADAQTRLEAVRRRIERLVAPGVQPVPASVPQQAAV